VTTEAPAIAADGLVKTYTGWMRHLAAWNPVSWALVAGRSALAAHRDWGLVASRGGGLLALAVAAVWLSTLTLRSYQKSV
jgi:ABC-2 type transport system permease protein